MADEELVGTRIRDAKDTDDLDRDTACVLLDSKKSNKRGGKAFLKDLPMGLETSQALAALTERLIEAEQDIEAIGQPLEFIDEATVEELNEGPEGLKSGWTYSLTNDGVLTAGNVEVATGDEVAWSAEKQRWIKVGPESFIKIFQVPFNLEAGSYTYPSYEDVDKAYKSGKGVIVLNLRPYDGSSTRNSRYYYLTGYTQVGSISAYFKGVDGDIVMTYAQGNTTWTFKEPATREYVIKGLIYYKGGWDKSDGLVINKTLEEIQQAFASQIPMVIQFYIVDGTPTAADIPTVFAEATTTPHTATMTSALKDGKGFTFEYTSLTPYSLSNYSYSGPPPSDYTFSRERSSFSMSILHSDYLGTYTSVASKANEMERLTVSPDGEEEWIFSQSWDQFWELLSYYMRSHNTVSIGVAGACGINYPDMSLTLHAWQSSNDYNPAVVFRSARVNVDDYWQNTWQTNEMRLKLYREQVLINDEPTYVCKAKFWEVRTRSTLQGPSMNGFPSTIDSSLYVLLQNNLYLSYVEVDPSITETTIVFDKELTDGFNDACYPNVDMVISLARGKSLRLKVAERENEQEGIGHYFEYSSSCGRDLVADSGSGSPMYTHFAVRIRGYQWSFEKLAYQYSDT